MRRHIRVGDCPDPVLAARSIDIPGSGTTSSESRAASTASSKLPVTTPGIDISSCLLGKTRLTFRANSWANGSTSGSEALTKFSSSFLLRFSCSFTKQSPNNRPSNQIWDTKSGQFIGVVEVWVPFRVSKGKVAGIVPSTFQSVGLFCCDCRDRLGTTLAMWSSDTDLAAEWPWRNDMSSLGNGLVCLSHALLQTMAPQFPFVKWRFGQRWTKDRLRFLNAFSWSQLSWKRRMFRQRPLLSFRWRSRWRSRPRGNKMKREKTSPIAD